jgi:hypothetical protein
MSPASVRQVVEERVPRREPKAAARTREWSRAWKASILGRVSSGLAIGSLALLFLDAAGTIEFVYTVTVSQLLMAAGCITGAPFIIDGWRRMPRMLQTLACALLMIYVLGAITGGDAVLPSAERAGGYRDLVYVADLLLGLAAIGLIVGLWRTEPSLRRGVVALFLGAAMAAIYGVYQALARGFAWPLEDINNAVNPDLVSYGDTPQGTGLFGIERVRGTFGEPHFLGGYLAALVPVGLATASFRAGRVWRGLAFAAIAAVAAAMALTASVPAWATLIVCATIAVLLCVIARGLVLGAALAGSLVVTMLLLVGLFLASPQTLAFATGRSSTDLQLTTEFRTDAWNESLELWAVRPVTGYGPGQGAIRLARRSPQDPTRVVLGSTQGLWAAALVDAGIVGFAAWAMLLGSVLWFMGRALFARQSPMVFALFTCAAVAVLGSQLTGDRLEFRVWAMLALALAVASAALSEEARSDESPT